MMYLCRGSLAEPRARRSVRNALLLALSLTLLGVIGVAVLAPAETRVSVDAVAEGLTCQCGCGLTVANCNHPQCEFSVPVRTQIEGMINRGMTRTQIIATFRAKYGEKILSAPTTEGFNLLAWLMPFGAIVAGCGLLFGVASRWRAANARHEPVRPDDNSGFDAQLRERLEAEIKENT
jgi:cytochrome c-type biogenesis protein CcmH/NrfF